MDSTLIFDNDPSLLTKYSFSQMKELYEEKIKKLKPKNVKKCLEIIQSRKELNIQINLLNETFQKKIPKKTMKYKKIL